MIGHRRSWVREELRMHVWADRLHAMNAEQWAGLRYVDGVLRDDHGRYASLNRRAAA